MTQFNATYPQIWDDPVVKRLQEARDFIDKYAGQLPGLPLRMDEATIWQLANMRLQLEVLEKLRELQYR